TANTYAGKIGGAGTNENNLALSKTGAGVLTLTSANTYTGTTSVSAGTLALGPTGSLAGGNISVTGTGTFAAFPVNGTPNSAGGSLSLASGTTFSMAGDGTAGIFNLGGSLTTLTTGAKFNFDLGTDGLANTVVDKLAIAGAATIGGTSNLI